MDRLAEIKRSAAMLRSAFTTIEGAPDPAPTLGFCEWLIAEVERLRVIEDAVLQFAARKMGPGMSADEADVIDPVFTNPRPGATGPTGGRRDG